MDIYIQEDGGSQGRLPGANEVSVETRRMGIM